MKRALALALVACGHEAPPPPPSSPPSSPSVVLDAGTTPTPTIQDASAGERGSLRLGAVVVSGKIARESVVRPLRDTAFAFRPCFENARVEGRITLHFQIAKDGHVTEATADRASDIDDPDVQACMVKAISAVAFTAPEDGNPVRVIAPVLYTLPASKPDAAPAE